MYDAYISVVGFENTSSNSQSSIVKPNINSKTIPYVQPETMTEATLEFYKKAFPNKTKEEILAMYRRDSK